jgi:hypothetical protein
MPISYYGTSDIAGYAPHFYRHRARTITLEVEEERLRLHLSGLGGVPRWRAAAAE